MCSFENVKVCSTGLKVKEIGFAISASCQLSDFGGPPENDSPLLPESKRKRALRRGRQARFDEAVRRSPSAWTSGTTPATARWQRRPTGQRPRGQAHAFFWTNQRSVKQLTQLPRFGSQSRPSDFGFVARRGTDGTETR